MLNKFIAVAVIAFGVPAQTSLAAIVDLTWSGVTVFGGNDGIGLFGPPAPMPANVPYVAEYRFDTSLSFFENATNGSEEVSGGVFYDPDRPTPWLSASITVNGTKVDVNGEYAASYYRQTGQGASQLSSLAQRLLNNPQPFGGELFQRVFRSGNFYSSPNPNEPGNFTFDASDNPGGNFSYVNLDPNGNIISNTQFGLFPQSLAITVVPEPAALPFASVITAGIVLCRRLCNRGRSCDMRSSRGICN